MTVVRFAASPSGWLHVGQARIALAAWLFTRHASGRMLLRLDDADPARARPHYAEAIGHDLHWLGLDWDATHRQSDHHQRYAETIAALQRSGRLYPCFESEEELRFKRELRLRRGQPPIYDRAMLSLTAAQRASAEAGGKRPHWRFRLSDATERWDDRVLGPREVRLPTVSDPVLVRADGTPMHTLMSLADDLALGITHLVRGAEHVANSAVRRDLMAALGVAAGRIALAHVPVPAGQLSLRRLRADGLEPVTVALYLAGGEATAASPDELVAGFAWPRLAVARFDPAALLALNRRILAARCFQAVAPGLPAGATPAFWSAIRGSIDLLHEARGWWDVVAGTIVPPVVEGEGGFLRDAAALLPPEPWDADVWDRWMAAIRHAHGSANGRLVTPLRLALTGEEQGPDLRALLPLMGRTRAAERLRGAAV